MSLEYLEDLEAAVTNGRTWYASPGQTVNEWSFSQSLDELRARAQRAADARMVPTAVYQLVNMMEVTTSGSYLVVRKVFEPGPRGEPRLHWAVVDTREAAEMLRDVSLGPTPIFGVLLVETFQPESDVA